MNGHLGCLIFDSFFERSHNGPEKYILLSRRYMSRFLINIFSKNFHIFLTPSEIFLSMFFVTMVVQPF